MSLIDGETYFNNFGQTGYEEIRDWTPAYYRNILEADANMYFAGWLKDVMAESLEKWCRNQFAAGMDEYTLGRMERFFYMKENATLDIEERRRLLGIAMAGTGKISTEKIAAWVKTYTGADCTFEFLHRLFQLCEQRHSRKDKSHPAHAFRPDGALLCGCRRIGGTLRRLPHSL